MADENRKTLTDDQIVTERKLPRRSFLTVAGTLLAGGAAAIVAVGRASAQDSDADKKEKKEGATDPDAKKKTGAKPKTKKTKPSSSQKETKPADPDAAKPKQ
ncbi:MAG TPA: hypothetical protein VKU44_09505 [Terriglobia bacterium]|nr:hypothetical protein [Terriglobia bacterium]